MSDKKSIGNIIISLFLSIIGFAYLTYYIFRASVDVIASDYIRIINYYVKNVTDLKYLLSWEGIACIPFTFLARFINVKYFNYSVFFDKILGLFGLVLFNFVTVKYALEKLKNRYIKITTSVIITFISFSLMSWEMILNGTGYPHFITIGLIALTFYLFGKNNYVGASKSVGASYASPIIIVVTSLLFAGSYSVAYLTALILVSLVLLLISLVNRKKVVANMLAKPIVGASQTVVANRTVWASCASPIIITVASLICLALYFKSANSGEQLTPVGFQNVTLREVMEADATFPIRFMLSSFASALIGVETLTFAAVYGTMTMDAIFIFGLIYVAIMLWTLFVVISNHRECNRRGELREPALVPYLYIIYSLISFVLVFFARYKFVRADYGMSSRYAIQYMFLTIGMILILSKKIDTIFDKDKKAKEEAVDKKGNVKNTVVVLVSTFSIFILVFGHVITTTDEMYKTSNRKLVYEYVRDVAMNYKEHTDDELMATFEYFRSPEHIKDALSTLEEQHLNIFKKQ